jgi:hypothetical protein
LASTFDADGNLRGQVAPDLHSDANTIDTSIELEVAFAMSGIDTEYEALVASHSVLV